ncbi:YhcH/YjgK/YiaL family protein [Iodobacter sp. LRB]|uniref:YhcH/YjgK/YiaL family protein n=1 Tax=unclassified Iodobacter TaxID=235634 RepID=UPI000C0EA413|nr:YhcH/YjgK/YiaL family protein [Iodobacter sp. BJB302]PHV03595.1 YhcH/YjgK/YiaL family protein [Iodobacter sp. BJB302]
MYLGHLHQAGLPLPAAIETALQYLRNTDFSCMETGRYPIDGERMFALVQTPLTQPWDGGKPEFHARYIDIQYLYEGEELIGYAPANEALAKTQDQLLERDIAFVAPIEGESRLYLTPGMFAIFYPGELHKPCRASHQPVAIKKVVIKIAKELITVV